MRFFRRESKEDVGRENTITITNSCVTKERPLCKKELWTVECVGDTTTRPKSSLSEFEFKETIETELAVDVVTSQRELNENNKISNEDNNSAYFTIMANELKSEDRSHYTSLYLGRRLKKGRGDYQKKKLDSLYRN